MATFPTFPNLDFSALDAGKLAELDDKIAAAVRDAAYVAIGFGVLAVQQAQVRRRELVSALNKRFGDGPNQMSDQVKRQVEDLVRSLEDRLGSFDERLDAFEATLDKAVGHLEERLPEQAATVVGQAHDLAKAARKQVRGLIRSAA
ncbi:MAG: hypothetical protein H6513_13490 [Acidimicrobiaceae bacterium]|nr:hypothetical protein [Ilumatobacter sp.]MCB9381695.1 hypothetical protein [Acidimicrobiaceae bacterium]MCO5329719.1 hypothetical protein [Ilumatobacteraceae bacterium]